MLRRHNVVLAKACLFTTPHQRHIRAERLVLSTSEHNTSQFGKNRLHGFRISEEMSFENVEDDGRIKDGRRISSYTISPSMGIRLRSQGIVTFYFYILESPILYYITLTRVT